MNKSKLDIKYKNYIIQHSKDVRIYNGVILCYLCSPHFVTFGLSEKNILSFTKKQ